MLDYKRNHWKYLAAVLCLLALFSYTLYQMHKTVGRIETSADIMVEQNAKNASQTIESKIGYAESSIRVIAHNIGVAMTSPVLPQPHYVLNAYLEESPFSFIEYVRADGINTLADGRELDARDRVYFKNGIQGKSGIWANYNPALSKEVLFDHYTPLYYDNKVVGVITGVIGGDTGLRGVLKGAFWGETCYNILCDGQGKIVTSNFSGNLNQTLATFLADKGMGKTDIEAITKQLNQVTHATFRLPHKDGYGLVSIAKVGNLDFYVLQVVPASSISIIKEHNLASYYGILIALALLLILVCILYKSEANLNKAMQAAKKELDVSTTVSKMYNSLHIIDLQTDTAEEYMATEEIRALVAPKKKATEKMFLAMKTLANPEWTERVLSFVDLYTVQDRLQDKDHIMLDFEGIHFWVRAFFTVMQRDEQGKAIKVIFVTRVIDQYMKDMQKLHRKANVDQLTGLFNRRAYEDAVKEYENKPLPDNLVIASIDVNGLKTVNDNIGHAAGDELIKAAAACMQRCLGSYGSVYRIGGDEFAAVLFVDEARLEEIKKDLDATVAAWHGNLVDELHMACAYAAKSQHPEADLKQLTDIADKAMYAEKELYYSQKGLDRRRQQYVFDVITTTYTKILRVNLTEDSYTIVRLSQEEIDDPTRPQKISLWLEKFGQSGRVHPDDKNKYLQLTKIKKLRQFFKNKKNHYSFYYRRDINGEYKYVMMEIMSASDYKDDQQIVYLMVKDVGTSNI